MPPLQTTYPATTPKAIEGMAANMEFVGGNVVSRVVEGVGGIGFGKVAIRGTADNQVKVSAAAGKFMGITLIDSAQEQDSYPQYATAQVLTQGVVWVVASVAVAAGDPAYFVPASGLLTNVSASNIAIPGGFFDSSTTGASQLAKLRLT
jgi:hypothetical protein